MNVFLYASKWKSTGSYLHEVYPVARANFGLSTVLEQDHFCSDFLVLHVTVLTNSFNPDDEVKSPTKP